MRVRTLCLLLLALCLALATPLVAQQTSKGTTTVMPAPNDTTTGTIQYKLAKLGPTGAVLPATTDTAVPIWIVAETAGNAGYASLNLSGLISCEMDATASNTRGWYVVNSALVQGRCHAQSAAPANGMVAGIMSDNSTTIGVLALVDSQLMAFVPGSGTGTGTMTQYNVVTPAEWTTSGCNVTTAGTCTIGKANQTANMLYAGPASGAAAPPGFRASVEADMPPSWMMAGDTTPTTLSGDAHNYGPAGWTTTGVLRINGGGADRQITGFAALPNGAVRLIWNNGTTNALILKDQNAGSSAANQNLFGSDVTLQPNETFAIRYDGTATKYRPFSDGVLDKFKVYDCLIPFGGMAASAPPLEVDDDDPATCPNSTGADLVIVGVACYADAGTTTVTPILTGGTATSILTAACTCGAATYAACTLSGTPVQHSFSGAGRATCTTPPCTIDANITASTGTKHAKIKITRVQR